MKHRRSSVWPPMLLLVVCAALAWVIYRQVAVAPNLNAAHGSTMEATSVPDLPPELQFSMRPVEDFDAILERPLFSPSRRPPAIEALESPPPNSDVAFTLKGILIDEDVRIALFRAQRNKQIWRLREGDTIEGWTIVRIERDSVSLARGAFEKILKPTFDQSRRKKRPPKKKK